MAEPISQPAANAGHAFATVLVDELVRHGVTDAVVAPGSRSTPIALALLANSRIRTHVRIDERSASYLALGIAKASRRPVPVLCTSGTAAAHFHAAVLEADLSRVPLLVLTADRPPELRGVGANQTYDQVKLYGQAVRWFCDVGVPESRADSVRYWRSVVSQAVAYCEPVNGPAGPVHLNLPLREPLGPVDDGVGFPYPLDGREGGEPWTRVNGTPPADGQPPPEQVRDGMRVVLVVGDGLERQQGQAVASYAARAGWPLIAEPHSQSRKGDAAIRCADLLLRDEEFMSEHQPDLAVVVGRVGLSRSISSLLARTPQLVVDEHASWWDSTRSSERILALNPFWFTSMTTLAPAQGWLDAWLEADEKAGQALDELLDAEAQLTEPAVARDVAALIPSGAALVVASSMPIRDLDLTMRPRGDVTVHANRGVSGIDGFVSTAQGIALAHDGPTYALCGDLSLLHDLPGLLPGPDERPDITYVVINNNGGGIFSTLPQAGTTDPQQFERVFGTPHGLSLPAVAASFNLRYALAKTPTDLAAALPPAPGVRLIEVRTDRAANADLHARLRTLRPR